MANAGPAESSVPVPVTEADDMSRTMAPEAVSSEPQGLTALNDDAVARRAYEMYEADGYRHGRDVEHWLAAEEELRQRNR